MQREGKLGTEAPKIQTQRLVGDGVYRQEFGMSQTGRATRERSAKLACGSDQKLEMVPKMEWFRKHSKDSVRDGRKGMVEGVCDGWQTVTRQSVLAGESLSLPL